MKLLNDEVTLILLGDWKGGGSIGKGGVVVVSWWVIGRGGGQPSGSSGIGVHPTVFEAVKNAKANIITNNFFIVFTPCLYTDRIKNNINIRYQIWQATLVLTTCRTEDFLRWSRATWDDAKGVYKITVTVNVKETARKELLKVIAASIPGDRFNGLAERDLGGLRLWKIRR